MAKHNILGILDRNKKERESEKFEPLPLELPLERLPILPPQMNHKNKELEEKTSERGVWTIDL